MSDLRQKAPSIAECRPEVLAFARVMEAKLRRNDHKGGWKDCDPAWLHQRLRMEVEELKREIVPPSCSCRELDCPHSTGNAFWRPNHESVTSEAADVANFAMMIADNEGDLKDVTPDPLLSGGLTEEEEQSLSILVLFAERFTTEGNATSQEVRLFTEARAHYEALLTRLQQRGG